MPAMGVAGEKIADCHQKDTAGAVFSHSRNGLSPSIITRLGERARRPLRFTNPPRGMPQTSWPNGVLVLEQAVEADTPKTIGAVEAHRKGREYAAKVFAAFAG
jgi:hypothetical protein